MSQSLPVLGYMTLLDKLMLSRIIVLAACVGEIEMVDLLYAEGLDDPAYLHRLRVFDLFFHAVLSILWVVSHMFLHFLREKIALPWDQVLKKQDVLKQRLSASDRMKTTAWTCCPGVHDIFNSNS